MGKYDHLNTLQPTTDLERFYDRILQNYDGGFFATDKNGICLYVSKSSEYFLGKPPEYLVGMSIHDMIDEGIVEFPATPVVMRDGMPHIRYSLTCTGVSMEVRAKPLLDENGETDLIVSYVLDEGASETVNHRYRESKKKYQEISQRYQDILHYLAEQEENNVHVVAESPAMVRVLQLARQVSYTDSTVLISGESGVGKEVLARYIHRHSSRHQQPFIPVNCAAIPAELAESEFFGYERGAFTGANKEGKPGLFELAEQGTLFLDEIGELSASLQSKLLRVLETGTIRRIGGKKELPINVRILAATNRDLQKKVTDGLFREDLYYRLNVLPIVIPPLRERAEDIETLAKNFLMRYNRRYKTNKVFSPAALEAFKHYSWPGNVRELRNMIERMATLSSETELKPDSYLFELTKRKTRHSEDAPGWSKGCSLKRCLQSFEARCISEALSQCSYDVTAAAQELEIPVSTLYQKMQKYGLSTKRHN